MRRARDLIVVTLDADFHLLIASTAQSPPRLFVCDGRDSTLTQAATVIQSVLELGYEILDGGAVASATEDVIRFKRLPLQRPK